MIIIALIIAPAKVSLSYEKAFANCTIRLSNRTKVTDYITACGKIDVQTPKIPAIQWVAGMGSGRFTVSDDKGTTKKRYTQKRGCLTSFVRQFFMYTIGEWMSVRICEW